MPPKCHLACRRLTWGHQNRPVPVVTVPDNDSQRQCHYPKRFTTRVHVGRLYEMLQHPAVNTHNGDGTSILHTISYCATGWPPVALIDPTLEDYSPAQMVVDLQAGSIDGVWGTWNLRAIEGWFYRGYDLEIWPDTQEKFSASGRLGGGLSQHIALVKAPARGLPVLCG